jgi:cell division protein ZapA (FtsZ GTPase activity inhibitor)
MSGDTKSYKITILGDTYSLVSDEPQSVIDDVAKHIGQVTASIKASAPQIIDDKKVSVLALLQVTIDLLSQKKLIIEYDHACERLIKKFDAHKDLV